MVKDLRLAQDAAEAAGAPTPLGAHATRLYAAMMEEGLSAKDFSVIARWLAAKSRTDLA